MTCKRGNSRTTCLARSTPAPRERRLLLVGYARGDVVELLAAGHGHDHGAADIDPMVADAGVRLEGEHHAWLQHGRPRTRRIGAGKTNIKLGLILVHRRAAHEEVRSERV